jgi:nucleoside-diphosphate-sugar epimerase
VGSEELVSIASLVDIVADIAGKRIEKRFVPGPTGVRGRRSDNRLVSEHLNWRPEVPLRRGLETTYAWIEGQVSAMEARPVAPALAASEHSRRESSAA